jgi:hypothetical protein
MTRKELRIFNIVFSLFSVALLFGLFAYTALQE